MTVEQIAVYRAVLERYVKGSDHTLNLANQTEPLAPSDSSGSSDENDLSCVKSFDLDLTSRSALLVHRFNPAIALNLKVVLVDPDEQTRIVKENDPQKLMGKGVTDKELDGALDKAFKTGLFTLSEILFDKPHRRAFLFYSFYCGRLCGHGSLVILKKAGKRWKINKTCGEWVS